MSGDAQALTEMLASFVAGYCVSNIPAAAVEPAKNVILDTVGVALAASARKIGTIISQHVAGSTPATASVFGAGIKASPAMAALANGTLANALDFDDGSHLATHILPACVCRCRASPAIRPADARRVHRGV